MRNTIKGNVDWNKLDIYSVRGFDFNKIISLSEGFIKTISDYGWEDAFPDDAIIYYLTEELNISIYALEVWKRAILDSFYESGEGRFLGKEFVYDTLLNQKLSSSECYRLKENGKKYVHNLKLAGYARESAWNHEHWGTDYNAEDATIEGNTLIFYTREIPKPIIIALSKMCPDTKLHFEGYDAEYEYQKTFDILNGNITNERIREGVR